MKNYDSFEGFAVIFGLIAFMAFVIIIGPFMDFWLAYFGGWIASLTIGDILCKGLNSLFQTTHFTKEMLPLFAGTLGWIGGFFKSISTVRSKSN